MGEHLDVRIPCSLAAEAVLEAGDGVDLTIDGKRLILTPVSGSEVRLEDLLARITPENLHAESHPGPRVGNEAW